MSNDDKINGLLLSVAHELTRATTKHGPINSLHEGYAIILEELDEAWGEIKQQHIDRAALRKELIQVAAMALRTIHDVL